MIMRAGFWRRMIALALDVAIVFVPWTIVLFAIVLLLDARGTRSDDTDRIVEILFYIPWLLYGCLEIFCATTLGKFALGMRIIRHDGTPADRWTLALRYIGKYYPFVFLVIGAALDNTLFWYLGGLGFLIVGIGCLYALGDEKRAWHDEWAGTAVALRQPVLRGFEIPPPTQSS